MQPIFIANTPYIRPNKQRSGSSSNDNLSLDLPNEIWAEVHSHLPTEDVVKLMGLNRYFFKEARNEIYRTITISDADDTKQVRVLQRLLEPDIASCVRHIRIQPDFLPLCDNHGKPLSRTRISGKDSTFLKKTMKVLYNCKNIEEATLRFHSSQAITTPFRDFFSTLISKASSRLQKLTISMSVLQFRIIDIISSSQLPFPNLSTVYLMVHPAYAMNRAKQHQYVDPPLEITESFCQYTHSFFMSLKPSLQSLHVTNYDLVDLTPVFIGLEGFTSLKKLDYRDCGRTQALSDLGVFEKLMDSSPDLERSSLQILVRSLWRAGPPEHYFEHLSWSAIFAKHSLTLQVTTLHNLCIKLPDDTSGLNFDTLSPSLAIFGPRLRSLNIDSSSALTYLQFQQILGIIVKFSKEQRGESGLETLVFRRLELFSPTHLDEALRKLPRLKVLAIGFERLSIEPQRTRVCFSTIISTIL
ncbi:hypothetical protein P691DRAFT_684047 [Macrolepiota fuliginosa MF-IS2]|uniref:F-box domain-containing protein n=1 Tax=Macrolepiota fuliginosa MF-IS2 TaxID=1400762 RepID=A0A9P5X0K6_9AGAR|nr:hypothetical protein P691DRAFT_684047 [Macrolepiota fuliginosa MF-IS2]